MSGSSFAFASVIVSTYNRPDALRLVLLGLDEQDIDAFEVVVADDGSTKETAEIIERLRGRVRYRLKHAWQEDRGFRAARARNLGVLQAEGDYLIFLDGDCVPLRDFVRGHRWLSGRGWWVPGHRVELGAGLTEQVLTQGLPVTRWPLWRWAIAKYRGQADRTVAALRLRTQVFRKRRPHKWKGAKTCNLGIWRDDFMRVDGMDESYVGYGREDSDLVIRLINAGVYRKEGRCATPILHLWHPDQDRSAWGANDALLSEALESGVTRARRGISQHMSNEPAGQ